MPRSKADSANPSPAAACLCSLVLGNAFFLSQADHSSPQQSHDGGADVRGADGGQSSTGSKSPAHNAHLARIRDNQRRSRARRKEYLQELENKFRACENEGVTASAEMQEAARRVLDENRRLREILQHKGMDPAEIDVIMQQAEQSPGAASQSEDAPSPTSPAVRGLEDLLATRRPCCARPDASQSCTETPPPGPRLAPAPSQASAIERRPSRSIESQFASRNNSTASLASTTQPATSVQTASLQAASQLPSPTAFALAPQQQQQQHPQSQQQQQQQQTFSNGMYGNYAMNNSPQAPAMHNYGSSSPSFVATSGPIPQGAISGYIQFVPVFTQHAPTHTLPPAAMAPPGGHDVEQFFDEAFDMAGLLSPSTQEQLVRGLREASDKVDDGGMDWAGHGGESGLWGMAPQAQTSGPG